jgi:hypothetical protein
MDYKRLLNSVGKTSFIENYEGYKNLFLLGDNLNSEHKKSFANELYDKNRESTSIQTQLTRVNCAINIFKYGLEKEVLNDIVLSTSKSVSKEVIEKAVELLNK